MCKIREQLRLEPSWRHVRAHLGSSRANPLSVIQTLDLISLTLLLFPTQSYHPISPAIHLPLVGLIVVIWSYRCIELAIYFSDLWNL